MGKSGLRRWAIKGAGAILLLAVIVLVTASGALLWLAGDSGRDWLAGQVEELASSEGAIIDITSIERLSSRTILIDRLTAADDQGVYLTVENLLIDYRFFRLLRGDIWIDRLMTETITISRIPQGDASAEEEPSSEISFQLPKVHIGRFGVETLKLQNAVTGKEENLQIEGRLIITKNLAGSDVALRAVDKTAPSAAALVDVEFAPSRGGNRLMLRAALEDEGAGPLSHLTGLKPLRLEIEGAGPLDAWKGSVRGQAGDVFSINGDLAFDLSGRTNKATFFGEWMAPPVTVSGETQLTYNSANGELQAIYKGDVRAPQITLSGLNLTAGVEPESALLGTVPRAGMRVRASGSWDNLRTGEQEVLPFVSDSRFHLSGLLEPERFAVQEFNIQTEGAGLAVSGTVGFGDRNLFLSSALEVKALSKLYAPLSGHASAALELSGTYQPLELSGAVRLSAANLQTPWDQATRLIGYSPQASADITINEQGLRINEGRLTGEAIEPVLFEGQAGGEPPASLFVETTYQGYGVNGRLIYAPPQVMARGFEVQGASLSAKAEAAYNTENEAVEASLSAVLDGGTELDLIVGGTAVQPVFSGKLNAEAPAPYQISFSGAASLAEQVSVTLRTLNGQIAGNELALASPVTVLPAGDTVTLDSARFRLDGGTLVFSGMAGAQKVDMRLTGINLPTNLNFSPFLYDGEMSLEASLSGLHSNLMGEADLEIKHMEIPALGGASGQTVSGSFHAGYQNKKLSVTTDLRGPENTRIDAVVSLPLSLVPFELPMDAPLQGSAQGVLDLRLLTLFAGLDQHRLRGDATLDLELGGTLADPAFEGAGAIRNGLYENVNTGTEIRRIDASLRMQNSMITLENFQGKGTGGGTVSGRGAINLGDIQEPSFELTVDLNQMQLVNTDRLGVTASGDLQVSGGAQGASVEGDIQVNSAEYFISRLGGTTSFGGFTIVEKGGLGGELAVTQKEKPPYPVRLDLEVDAAGNIFIRGPDIDTEWAADLVVQGTLDDPVIRGELSVVRGSVQLIDTPIQLSEGGILFNNPQMSNPTLDLTGEIQGQDLDATVRVQGEAKSPEVTLSSDPALPEDEILARVLFGASVSELTPLQGLKIARTVAALSGRGGGGPDPLSRVRQAIGLDALSVGYDEEQGATLSVGKYVGENIYIGVDQGVRPGSSAVRAEIDVTEEIEVETRLGSTNESSVGVNWKHDY